jgi:hypothetical protein
MSFQLIQVALVVVLLLLGFYIFRLRSILLDRLILLAMAIGGAFLVLMPDLSTWIANQIGVGRGTDLILYCFIVFCLFQFAGMSAGERKLQGQITQIVRSVAIRDAEFGALPGEQNSGSE